MIGWRELFSGWQFRSRRPVFHEGERLTAYVTGYDEDADEGEIRIGDSVLRVEGLDPGDIDGTVTVTVTEFDPASGVGRARPGRGDG